jgi:monoterpene epsilon-lactone hydrolase
MSIAEIDVIRGRIAESFDPDARFSVEGARRDWYVETKTDIVPAGMEVFQVEVAGCALEGLHRQGAGKAAAVLFLHGGGYVCGSIASHRPLTVELARTFDGIVWSLDYRLAPEHPFPAALDDTLAAFDYIVSTGVDPRAICIAGDSAGGGLAAGVLVALKKRGLNQAGAGWCISPWADMALRGETLKTLIDKDPMVFPGTLEASSLIYLGGHGVDTEEASPAYADLEGLPPLLIQIGSTEILIDDAVALARNAGLAGVETRLEIWPHMIHVWHLFPGELEEARKAIADAAEWLKPRLTVAA